MVHCETCKHHQSSSKAHANALQNLKVGGQSWHFWGLDDQTVGGVLSGLCLPIEHDLVLIAEITSRETHPYITEIGAVCGDQEYQTLVNIEGRKVRRMILLACASLLCAGCKPWVWLKAVLGLCMPQVNSPLPPQGDETGVADVMDLLYAGDSTNSKVDWHHNRNGVG